MSRVSRTIKFKIQVVLHFLSTTDGQRKTATRFGVDQSDVRQWVNLYKAHGDTAEEVIQHCIHLFAASSNTTPTLMKSDTTVAKVALLSQKSSILRVNHSSQH
jgi:transposase-like protein